MQTNLFTQASVLRHGNEAFRAVEECVILNHFVLNYFLEVAPIKIVWDSPAASRASLFIVAFSLLLVNTYREIDVCTSDSQLAKKQTYVWRARKRRL